MFASETAGARGALLLVILSATQPANAAASEPASAEQMASPSADVNAGPGHKAAATGVTLGVRAGWGLPLGDRAATDRQTDTYSSVAPIWLDAGYRVSRKVSIGAYFQYAFVFVQSSFCGAPLTSCSAHDVTAGLGVQYHLLPEKPFDPWLGAGTGYQVTTLTVTGGGSSASRSDHGVELLSAQFGVDYALSSSLRVGPFVHASFGEYLTTTIKNPSGPSGTYDLQGSLHELLLVGMRGRYEI